MSTFVSTESGATYEFTDGFQMFRRTSPDAPLRKDGEWLECEVPEVRVGKGMRIRVTGIIEPPSFTIRFTTPVTAIWDGAA